MADKITKDERQRYFSVVDNRIKDKIKDREKLLTNEGVTKETFLKSKNVYEEYCDLQLTKQRIKELENVVSGALDSCSGDLEWLIKKKIEQEIATDSIILSLRKIIRQSYDRIMLARTYDELDRVLIEIGDDN